MAKYKDDLYEKTIIALIGDIYYAENVSYDSKIARMRKLAEIIVRRLIRQDSNSALELGDPRTKKALNSKKMTEPFFRDALEVVRKSGNYSAHSQGQRLPEKADFDRVSNALTNIYAYLFYNFFKKHEFGENPVIVSSFSLLPPYFRFFILKELLLNNKGTVEVMDKLPKAAIKSFGVNGALEWTENNKNKLQEIDTLYGSEDIRRAWEFYSKLGPEGCKCFARELENMQGNMYEYMRRMIPNLAGLEKIPEDLKYTTFEEAKKYYVEKCIIKGGTEDAEEFNSIMNFIYVGRREEEKGNIDVLIKDIIGELNSIRGNINNPTGEVVYSYELVSALERVRKEIGDVLKLSFAVVS